MPKFRTILELTIKAKTQADADEVGSGAAAHLLETFNDDESIAPGVRVVTGGPVNVIVPADVLAVPILQRCESFISGFEDDPDQEGIPALLADIREAIAGKPAPAARPFDAQELATVLAALRCYQQVRSQCGGDIPEDLQDIADNGGKFEAFDDDDIDGLCERLNLGEVGTVAPATHSAEDSSKTDAGTVWVLSWDVRNANEQTGTRIFASEALAVDQVIAWLDGDFGDHADEAAVRGALLESGYVEIKSDVFYSITGEEPRTSIQAE